MLRCICMKSCGSSFLQQFFTFDFLQRGTVVEQTILRPHLAVFTSICSPFQQQLFCKTNQSSPPKNAKREKLVTCVLSTGRCFSTDRRTAATDHISTSKADTYKKPHVSEPKRFKAWPSNTFFFSSKMSRVQWPPNNQTQAYTSQPFLSRLSYSVPVFFERVSEQFQRCNCYPLETRNVTGDRLARTNWNHYSPLSLVPVKLCVCRNVVSYCIQACAPPNLSEPV